MALHKLKYFISCVLLLFASQVFAQNTHIDHVLIAVPDLEAAKAEYENYGFKVVYGGTDKKALNALIFLSDRTLIELIGKDRFPKYYSLLSGIGITRLLGLMKDRIAKFRKAPEGLFNYCLYARDLDSTYTYLKKNGIKCNKPVQLKRKREDGMTTKWSLVGTKPYDLPFFINDYTPPRLSDSTLLTHNNGAAGIDSLIVTTDRFEFYVKVYNTLYNMSPYISGTPGLRKAEYILSHQSVILSESTGPFTTFRKKQHSVPVKVYLKNLNKSNKKELNSYLNL